MKFVEQIAVFLENSNGRLKECSKAISDAGIDIISLNIADTRDFGIVRMITRDNEQAVNALKKRGFMVSTNRLVAVLIKNHPGALTRILTILENNSINVEYLYSFSVGEAQNACIMLKVNEEEKVGNILEKEGVVLTCNTEL